MRWTLAHLWLACAVLAACATPQRSSRRDLRLDSETAAKVTHASALIEGGSSAASTATAAVASTLGQAVPTLLAFLEHDNAVGELEEQLVECAKLAERQVNSRFFGNRSPTRQECGEEVFVDGCDAPISRARHLGKLNLDFKFPCPDTNQPQWTRYGENSAYAGSDQQKVYKDALGGEARIISPRRGISQ